MFDGLELNTPESVKAPEEKKEAASPAVSAFSFLNSESATTNEENEEVVREAVSKNIDQKQSESLLDLNTPVAGSVDIFALVDSQPELQQVPRRPIIKKRRGKKVGYERDDNDSPVRGISEESLVTNDEAKPYEETVRTTEESPAMDTIIKDEEPIKEVANEQEMKPEQMTVPEYSASKDESKPKKAGVLRRMFGPKRSKDSLVSPGNDERGASSPPSPSPKHNQQQEEQKKKENGIQKVVPPSENDEEEPSLSPESIEDKEIEIIEKEEEDEEKIDASAEENNEKEANEQPQEEEKEVIVKKSPEEELAEKMDEFVRGTTDLCFRLSEHERRTARVAREREELGREQASFEAELKAKVKEQEAYAEAEDYERADELSTAVERAKQEMALRAAALRDLALELDRDEREMQQRRRDRLKAVDELKKWLLNFESAQREAVRIATTEAAQRREAAARRVAAEAERLAMERAHVDRDKAHVAEEFERIEKLIENQTLPYASKRAELAQIKAMKDAEINELRSRLETLESERTIVEAQLAATDESIELARSKFERPLQRLKQRDAMLQESAADCDSELEALEREKDAIAQAAIDAKEAAHTQSRLAALAANELTVAEQLADTARIWEEHTPTLDNEQDTTKNNDNNGTLSLQALQVAVAEAEQASHEARRKLQALESKRTALAKERKRLEDDLPQLEASKKAAATARNYKEAGAIAKQIKTLTTKRDELDSQLLDLTPPLDEAQQLADSLAHDHDKAKSNLADQERASVVELYKALRKKQRDLERARRTFAKLESNSKLASAAKNLAKVELSTVATKADDLVREQNFTDLPPESDLSEEENEEENQQQSANITESTITSTLVDTEEDALPASPDNTQLVDNVISPSLEEKSPVAEDIPITQDITSTNESEIDPEEKRKKEEEIKVLRTQLEASIAKIEADIDAAVEVDDFDSADALSTQADELKAQLDALGPS